RPHLRTNTHFRFSSNAPPPTEIYTLSLHDALPILRFVQHFPRGAHPAQNRFDTRRHLIQIEGLRDEVVGAKPQREDPIVASAGRSEEHTSELQSRSDLVCRLLLEKKKTAPTTAAKH